MTDEDLITRIKFIVDRLSFRIGDLTLMYEHKQVDPDDFYEEVNYTKGDFIKSIMKLIREHEQPMQTILDPCCGGRMFYFEKNHPNILYLDRRSEVVEMKDRGAIRTLNIEPDYIADFTNLDEPNNSFNFVVFDPPHLINCGKNSWLAKKYGKLDKDTWQDTLSKGLSECLRVVKPGCVVAMKWSERDIKTTELLKILPQKPAFGDKSGMTRWLFFVKGVEDDA